MRLTFWLGTLTVLGSCTLQPAAPDPANQEGRLDSGEVIDFGPGERTLLEDYTLVVQQKAAAEDRVERLRGELELMKADLERAERERDVERRARATADAEFDRLARETRDLRAKVLAESIARVRMEQRFLEAQIEHLRNTVVDAAEAAAPDGGGR